MSAKTILLIEQNEKVALSIKSALRQGGYAFHMLQDGEDVFTHLNKHPVDVILLNVRLQGMGAKSLCSLIRNDAQYHRFPLIILYGKSTSTNRIEYLKQGADDFVGMPFTPVELTSVITARLRPLSAINLDTPSLSLIDRTTLQLKTKHKIPPLESKGSLEVTPLTSILSRLFVYKESGILNLIIKKEARTVYFKSGDIVFAESNSRNDDIGDYMARNRAGTGTPREIIGARTQSGGPGSNPNEFLTILKESGLMDPETFKWWLRMHIVDLLAEMSTVFIGNYQWQSIQLPDYAKNTKMDPISTPQVVFEGVRRIKRWWDLRKLLPSEDSVPILVPDFFNKSLQYGISIRENTELGLVNGKRKLREIREICHQVTPHIDNFIYACHQLQVLAFNVTEEEMSSEPVDIHATLDLEDGDLEEAFAVEVPEPVVVQAKAPPTRTVPRPVIETRAPEVKAFEHRPSRPAPISIELPTSSQPVDRTPRLDLSTGLLEDIPVPEIFRKCIGFAIDGCVEFTSSGTIKKVFWKKGKIISVISNDSEERLDNFLFHRKLIDEGQHEQLGRAVDNDMLSPNEVLKRRILSIEQIFNVVKEQILSMVESLFTWTTGTFRFIPEATAPRDIVPLDISPVSVIMNILRQLENWSHLERRLPGEGDLVHVSQSGKSLRGATLSPLELRIMKELQEPLPVLELVRRIGQDSLVIRKSLYAMTVAGVIESTGQRRM